MFDDLVKAQKPPYLQMNIPKMHILDYLGLPWVGLKHPTALENFPCLITNWTASAKRQVPTLGTAPLCRALVLLAGGCPGDHGPAVRAAVAQAGNQQTPGETRLGLVDIQ